MKKAILRVILTLMMIALVAIPAQAMETVDGPSAGLFGSPTSVEEVIVINGFVDDTININRSKDSAFIPPPFGSPASNTLGENELLTPGISGITTSTVGYADNSNNVYIPAEASYSAGTSSGKFTLPEGLYYSDGSIGILSIPKLKLTVKVFEEESPENLKKGIGHFKSTSCWEGNIGFAAHNRGLADYFGEIHTLSIGDKIIYDTKLGTRTYEVFFVGKIAETDYSRLGRTNENIVTLITCVRDMPSQRWCVQAREIN